jgi:hypothetical protein
MERADRLLFIRVKFRPAVASNCRTRNSSGKVSPLGGAKHRHKNVNVRNVAVPACVRA